MEPMVTDILALAFGVTHRRVFFVPQVPLWVKERCPTHRPLSSSFLGLPYKILNINHQEELLRGPWVIPELARFWSMRLTSAVIVLQHL